MSALAAGIDVGGTNIKAGVVNSRGKVLTRLSRETRAKEGLETVVTAISEVCEELTSSHSVSCIGVGAPGLVDPNQGVVRRPPNLPGWESVPLKDLLEAHLSAPVLVANDVDMVTYGEWKFGAGKGVEDLLLITVGTGVGGGIVAAGRLHLGSHGLAGEIGHTTIKPDGPLCNCGNHGCLESFVGAEYLQRKAIRLINNGVSSSLSESVGGDLDRITPEVISRAAAKGDGLSQRLLNRTGEYIGIALANAISILDPERVVVGGGVSKAGEVLFEPIRQTIKERLYSYPETQIEVVPAELGDHAGVIGAATYAISQLG